MWGGARVRRLLCRSLRAGDAATATTASIAPSTRSLHAPYQLLVASTAISLGGGFTLLLPILTATTAWKVWRDRPYRTHWLVPVAVGAAFTLAFFDVRTAAQFREWQWRLMVAGSVSLMIAGALDHRLLMNVMTGAGAAEGGSMPTSSEPRLEDIRRIAFVTERFHDLQGLRTVANAVPPLIFAALFHSAQSARNAIMLGCALVAYVVVRATWIRSGIEALLLTPTRPRRPERTPQVDGTLLFCPVIPTRHGDRSGPDFWRDLSHATKA